MPLLPRDRASPSRSRRAWSSTRSARSSVVYRIGLFQGAGDEAAAEGRFVHVYVDNTDPARPVTPIPDEIRSALQPLLRP